MKRAVRWALLSAGLASVVTAVTVAVTVVPSWATPPSGLTNIPLARGTNTSHGTIPLQFGADVAVAQITVAPGGSSGWHSHLGGAIIVVKQGSLTVYSALPGPGRGSSRDIAAGEKLSSVRVANDPLVIAAAVAEAGPEPEVVIEGTVP